MNIILRHTLGSIKRNPVQSVIVVVSTAMITACVLVCLCISSLFEQLTSLWGTSRYGGADLIITGYYATEYGGVPFGESLRAYSEEHSDEIAAVLATYESSLSVMSSTETVRAYGIIAEDLDRFDSLTGAEILSRCENTSDLPSAHVSLAFSQATDLSLGETFTTKNGSSYFISAICNNTSRYFNQSFIVFAAEGDFSDDAATGVIPSRTAVYLTDADAVRPDGTNVADAWRSYFTGITSNPQAVTAGVAETELDMAESVRGSMRLMTIAASVITVVMACLLFSSFSVIVRGRVTELIKFKAAGATPLQTTGILLAEAALYAVVGGLIGLAFGEGLITYLDGLLARNIAGGALVTEAYKYPLAVIIGAACGIAACIIPAVRMSAKSIRSLTGDGERLVRAVPLPLSVAVTITAAAFAVALFLVPRAVLPYIAVTFIVLSLVWAITVMPHILRAVCALARGITRPGAGFVAECAAPRNASVNSSVTMLATVIAFISLGAAIIDIVGYTSLTSTARMSGDFIVGMSGVDYETVEAEYEYCLSLDGITDGALTRTVSCRLAYGDGTEAGTSSGSNAMCYSVEKGADMRFLSLDIDEAVIARFDATENAAVISSYISNKFGINVGDSICLRVTQYTGEAVLADRSFTVVGIDNTVTSWDMAIFVRTSELTVGGELPNGTSLILLNGDENSFTRLRDLIDTDSATLYKRGGYFSAEGGDKLDTSALLSVFTAIVYAIAVIGLINLIVITATERVREFDILRLAGMTPGDALRYIVTETGILAAVGCAAGFVFSVLFNRASTGIAQLINKFVRTELLTSRTLIITAAGAGIFIVLWSVSHMLAFARASSDKYRKRDDRMLRSE